MSQPNTQKILSLFKPLLTLTLFKSIGFDTDDPWNSLMKGRLGVTTANLFRKSTILDTGGWNENLKSSQEYELMFRLLKNGATIKIDNENILPRTKTRNEAKYKSREINLVKE
jgi:hypothetical protein